MLQCGEFHDGLGDLCSAGIANHVGTEAPCSGREASALSTCHSTSPNYQTCPARPSLVCWPNQPLSRIFTDYNRPQVWSGLRNQLSQHGRAPSRMDHRTEIATHLSHTLAVPSPIYHAALSASHKHAPDIQAQHTSNQQVPRSATKAISSLQMLSHAPPNLTKHTPATIRMRLDHHLQPCTHSIPFLHTITTRNLLTSCRDTESWGVS